MAAPTAFTHRSSRRRRMRLLSPRGRPLPRRERRQASVGWSDDQLLEARAVSVKAEHDPECLVDVPHLFGVDMADSSAKTLSVDGPDLLHEHTGWVTADLNLGAERCRARTPRGGCDQDDRPGKELVGLDDDPMTDALLLMSRSSWNSKPMDVTPAHEAIPSARRRRASRRDRRGSPPARRLPRQVASIVAVARLRRVAPSGSPRICSFPMPPACGERALPHHPGELRLLAACRQYHAS